MGSHLGTPRFTASNCMPVISTPTLLATAQPCLPSGKTLVFSAPMLMIALQEEMRLPLVSGEGPVVGGAPRSKSATSAPLRCAA